MLKGLVRLAACAASGAAFLALTGCGGAAPDDGYAGPPASSYDRGAPPPVLMGQTAPAARPGGAGLAGGPGDYAGMAPIPNPADLTRAERVKFYGHRYDYLPEPKGKTAAPSIGAPRFQLITRRKADGTLQISMRPIANPEDMTASERRRVYGSRYAPRAVTGGAPRRSWRATPVARPSVAPAPVLRTTAVVRPAVKLAPAPRPAVVVAAKPATPPVLSKPPAPTMAVAAAPAAPATPATPAPKANPTQQLQTAVSATINRGASLSVPADLKAGKQADVILSLPGDLLAMVQAQAAKLGLGKAARKVDAYANLQGQGYQITPPGQQNVPVVAGKPTTFTWTVKPGAGDKKPLRADYGLELKGIKPTTAFSVGSLEEALAAPIEAAKDAAKGFNLPELKAPEFKMPEFKMPSLKSLAFPWVPELDVPGLGKVARENLVGAALAILALILVVAMANGASAGRARAERRRKFRTMQDYGVNEPDHPAPDAHHTGYVNPMIAAAGGAAGGYALASGHDDHPGQDDHGHAHDDHHGGQDDHGHDAHGHDAHGHDAHPTSHAPDANDDHGHGPDNGHGHDEHAPVEGYGDQGPQHVSHHPEPGHDAHGHEDGHGHDTHGADAHGHDDHHGHDPHHKEPEHAH